MDISEILGFDIQEVIDSVFREEEELSEVLRKDLSKDLVVELSRKKKEPEWMLRLRLRAFEVFEKKEFPQWLKEILDQMNIDLDLRNFRHYVSSRKRGEEAIKELLEYYRRLGLTESEISILLGISLQSESEVVYNQQKELLRKMGVTMIPMEEAVQKDYSIVRKYFSKIFPISDHKFSALHYAFWSGGVFVHVPEGVKVKYPVEAMFIVSQSLESQFEHSLIVAEKNSEIKFIEGCVAPSLKSYSFHDGTIEIYAGEGSKVEFWTMQNWGKDIINFNNKRAIAERNSEVNWIEVSLGSLITVTYPSTILRGDNSSTLIFSLGVSKGKYWKDNGAKVIHVGKNTRSRIISKSISAQGGISVYRGMVRIMKGAKNAISNVSCDSLILDGDSIAITIPHNIVEEKDATLTHEAFTLSFSEEQKEYLQSRGLNPEEAINSMVIGFARDIMKYIQSYPLLPVILGRVLKIDFEEYGTG